MLKAMAQSKVKPVIDQVFSFADYSKAYERLESGKHVGKIVIKISD
jgi:NADPH:quinone reductase-like Zn-dependent oxidoreductase